MHGHFIKKCDKGHVLETCKCMGGNKQTIIVTEDDCPICLDEQEWKSNPPTRHEIGRTLYSDKGLTEL